MKKEVLDAVREAFHPSSITDHLEENGGRVFGSVTVEGSKEFDELDGIRRQQRLWRELRSRLGPNSVNVGPIGLEPR